MDITIQVDFNAQSKGGLVSLSTRGARKSLEGIELHSGRRVMLTDGELIVPAVIVAINGVYWARPVGPFTDATDPRWWIEERTRELHEQARREYELSPPPIARTCENCGWWDDDIEAGIEVHCELYREETNYGECKCPAIVYLYGKDGIVVKDDRAVYYDAEGYAATFATGPKFGCIHWKPKEEENDSTAE